MLDISLKPYSTGKPRGSVTGEAMIDYVLLDEPFMRACKDLAKQGFSFPLFDRFLVFRVDATITVEAHHVSQLYPLHRMIVAIAIVKISLL
jgi:hypothetical protein